MLRLLSLAPYCTLLWVTYLKHNYDQGANIQHTRHKNLISSKSVCIHPSVQRLSWKNSKGFTMKSKMLLDNTFPQMLEMLSHIFFNVVTKEKQQRHTMPTLLCDLPFSKLCPSINQSQCSSVNCNTKCKSLSFNEYFYHTNNRTSEDHYLISWYNNCTQIRNQYMHTYKHTYIHSIDPWACHKTIGCGTCHKHTNIWNYYSVRICTVIEVSNTYHMSMQNIHPHSIRSVHIKKFWGYFKLWNFILKACNTSW